MQSSGGAEEEPSALHERLVAHVHSVNGDPSPRTGIWQEHSYACGEEGLRGRRGGDARELLGAPRPPPSPCGDIDVDEPPLPAQVAPLHEDEPDDWEARLADAVPGTAALCAALVRVLRDLRLCVLVAPAHSRDDIRHAARRARRLLSALWPTPNAARLHTALLAHLPRLYRQLYQDVLAELRRTIPRLIERLAPGGALPPAAEDPPRAGPAVMPCSSRPLLVWVGSGRPALDARWERRLRALVPTHYVRAWSRASGGPTAWCTAVAAAARAELAALEAGGVSWSLLAAGGAGAGAAVATMLAGDGQVGAVISLGGGGVTAEGWPVCEQGRWAQLAVVGRGGRWRARLMAERRGHPRDRVVGVPGADGALRLRSRSRRSLLVTQAALDAAVCDEAARWLYELADDPLDDIELDSPPHYDDNNKRSIEIVEGRVVSRVPGAVPVSLLPPAPRSATTERTEVRSVNAAPRYTKVIVAKRG